MTWCNNESDEDGGIELITHGTTSNSNTTTHHVTHDTQPTQIIRTLTCPSCGHNLQFQDQGGINELPGLPAGVRFDPNDQEILEHLEAKVVQQQQQQYCDHDHVPKLHPLIHEFIPTLEGENGICYTHPEKLPGVSKDGQIRHFFHRPSKAYTTGTRKRRKVETDEVGSETRWHKTGKTRPVYIGGTVKGFKKILVLYTNYGRQKKPEKTNWVMHQYHLGSNEEEKDGELVVSKVFYQTQPRQCGTNNNNNSNITIKDIINPYHHHHEQRSSLMISTTAPHPHPSHDVQDNINVIMPPKNAPHVPTHPMDYYNPTFINYDHMGGGHNMESSQLIPNLVMQGGDHSSSFIRLEMDTNKTSLDRK